MVCRECGAYNAEHLSHCRVCAARLKDAETEQFAEEPMETRDSTRPQRDFVRAPSWPTRAYAGAPEKPAYAPPAPVQDDSFDAEEEAEVPVREPRSTPPVAERRAAAAPIPPRVFEAPVETPVRYCESCGKQLLPDAPFCAYCGTRAGQPAERVETPRRAAAFQAPPPVVKPDDDFDLDDADDDAPRRGKPAARKAVKPAKAKKAAYDDEDDDEYDDDYDDDDDFDDDDDDDEDSGRGGKGGKGTTILFWALIVLLVALIGVFGMYIIKKNYGGDIGNLIAAVTGKTVGDDTSEPDASQPDGSTPADSERFGTGTITETVVDGVEIYEITVYAPTNSTIKINTVTELENGGMTTIPKGNSILLRIPRAAFMPNEPQASEIVTITPDIVATTPEGQVMQVQIPSVQVTVPALELNITEPAGLTTTAPYGNAPITIAGTVADHTVSVFVNGEQCTVMADGTFSYSFQPAGGTTAELVTVEAKKNNFKTTAATVTVEPYVEQNMSLLVSNDVAGLKAVNGSVTLTGTVTPGASITATNSSASVKCGSVSTTATGSFSLNVVLDAVGAFEVQLAATQPGYKDAAYAVMVEREPTASSSAFRKAAKALSAAEHAKIAGGSVVSGDYTCVVKILEIVGAAPYTIVKCELTSGEQFYLCNRSAKNVLGSDDVNKKKEIAGTCVGTYLDTNLPYIWTWFIWNK